MAAPGGEESFKPFGLASALAAAALFFALSACGPSQKKQGAETAAEPASAPRAAATSNASTSPTTSSSNSTTGQAPSATSAAASEQNAVDIGSIAIESDDGANNGSPIIVDLVLIYDATLIPQIESETAAAWFKGKAALTASAGTNLSVMSWTIAAGDEVPETEIDLRSGALAAFVFASYSGKGDHRLRIDGSGALTVTLGANDPTFEVEQ